jgi:hypothetical protein
MGDNPVPNAVLTETDFGTAAVYSLGPNGVPGAFFGAPSSILYFREIGLLGTADDQVREF